MKSFAALVLAASAVALPQQSGSDCQDSRSGSFAISVVNVTDSSSSKRAVERRQLSGTLTLTLDGGVLKDQAGRQGYIASNHQFQFDQPIQAGALEKSGFSVCGNSSLALGGDAIFYQCYSGDFYNLYDKDINDLCNPIYIYAQDSSSETGAATQQSDGQPAVSTQVSAPAVTVISDGQPQAPTSQGSAPLVSVISDGQPQAPTSQAASAPLVSVISDGQPQAPTSQASAPLVSVISDGQPQAPTEQAPAPTPAPSVPAGQTVTQISDGQPQAPIATGAGNYSAPNATAPSEFPGAASTPMVAAGALVAGLIAMFAML